VRREGDIDQDHQSPRAQRRLFDEPLPPPGGESTSPPSRSSTDGGVDAQPEAGAP
jgi:hypothetical protein